MTEIRPYRESDESDVIALWSVVFPDDPPWNAPGRVIANKLGVQRELFLVCDCEGTLVGTVLAGFDGVRGWIHKLAVRPDRQGEGFARQLLEQAEAGLLALGCPKVNLQVRASNAAVVAVYERAGYVVEERISMGKRLERSVSG